ncbi:MAG TPA: EAL domain-containing protein [Gaiellaceae bacterium]|nr:EAL domain-containing protein [Gaiellaceae bacterium]
MTHDLGRSLTRTWMLVARTSSWLATAVVAGLLAASWSLAYGVGGAGVAAPHWFYVPIAVAASRFGYVGAALTGLAAGVLAGPLLPLSTATGEEQHPSDWLTRTGFFVALGLFVAWLIATNRGSQQELGATRRRMTTLESLLERHARHLVAERWAVERLRSVLDAGGPDVVFQPVVDLRDGELAGVEALARFGGEPRRGPAFWFDQAWKAGLGAELELVALRAAVRTAEPLLEKGLPLSVNLSPEVVASADFRELIPELPAERLVIEVTEHAQVEDYQALAESVRLLRARGGRLAADDVGAGFASLRHILDLAPDVIKLDVSLTRAIDADRRRRALAASLVTFARELGCLVVAEGIETRDELAVLQSLGVPRGQGYFLGRPVEVGQIDAARTRRALERAGLRATA